MVDAVAPIMETHLEPALGTRRPRLRNTATPPPMVWPLAIILGAVVLAIALSVILILA